MSITEKHRQTSIVSVKNDIPEMVKPLDEGVADQLGDIEPSISAYGLRLFPCEAVLDDGSVESRVYVVEARGYLAEWGVWPWQDLGKRWIPAERIRSVRSSPLRLAAQFANELNAAGESGMGYCIFSVELRDGRRIFFLMGNAVDFPSWPKDVCPDDVVSVRAHDRHPDYAPGADYAWCPIRSAR
ncbi:MAG: hypothetical protein DCC68_08355 [Planctomycetota bacterium]|nr:MAG: hypothetical protein DCC68_08355 [Planctomycetota bacterium]